MTTPTTALSFPVPAGADPAVWALGSGFDPNVGAPVGPNGFASPEPDIVQLHRGSIVGGVVSDSSSHKASLDVAESAHGSGWGATVNESVSSQFQAAFSSQSVTLWYYGNYQDFSRYVRTTQQELSDAAKNLLTTKGYDAFCSVYGTHFVFSTVIGSALYLQYQRTLRTAAMQASYSESVNEKFKGFGVSESMSETMSVGVATNTSNYRDSMHIVTYGFVPPPFNGMDDMEPIMAAYSTALADADGQSTGEGTIVAVSVRPWSDLDAVALALESTAVPSSVDIVDADLAVAYKQAAYIAQSALHFNDIDHELYAGYSQYDAVATIRTDAAELQTTISGYVSSGDATEEEVGAVLNAETDLYHQLLFGTSNFTLSWFLRVPMSGVVLTTLAAGRQQDGTMPTLANKGLDGSTPGSLVQWGTDVVDVEVAKIDREDTDGTTTPWMVCRVVLDPADRSMRAIVSKASDSTAAGSGNPLTVGGSINAIPADEGKAPMSVARVNYSSGDYQILFQVTAI